MWIPSTIPMLLNLLSPRVTVFDTRQRVKDFSVILYLLSLKHIYACSLIDVHAEACVLTLETWILCLVVPKNRFHGDKMLVSNDLPPMVYKTLDPGFQWNNVCRYTKTYIPVLMRLPLIMLPMNQSIMHDLILLSRAYVAHTRMWICINEYM